MFFEHGTDPEMIFKKKSMKARRPMHIAAQEGSLNVVLALISRGATVDPMDED